jgi:HK97 gp10 family phage protein
MAKGVFVVDKQSMALTQKSIKKLQRELNGRGKRKAWNDMLTPSAKILQDGMESVVPVLSSNAPNPHYMYSKKRGKVAYYRGNLRRSIRMFKGFRKSDGIFVGPRMLFDRAKGTAHRSRRDADGFYALMVNFGTKKMRPRPYVKATMAGFGDAAKAKLISSMKKYVKTALTKV